jgi:hypothetical protein
MTAWQELRLALAYALIALSLTVAPACNAKDDLARGLSTVNTYRSRRR